MTKFSRTVLTTGMFTGALLHAACGSDSTPAATNDSTPAASNAASASSASSATTVSSSNGSAGTGGTGATSSSSGETGGTTSSAGGSGGTAGLPFSSVGASSHEAESSIAANAKGDVVAVWIAFLPNNVSGIGYVVSHDSGVTWTAPGYVKAPGGLLTSTPGVVVDSQGRFSLTFLGFSPNSDILNEHIYLAQLAPGGDLFEAPVLASDDGTSTVRDFDKPAISVDANDNVLLTWSDFTGNSMGTPASTTFARTTDGKTFTRTTVASDTTDTPIASSAARRPSIWCTSARTPLSSSARRRTSGKTGKFTPSRRRTWSHKT